VTLPRLVLFARYPTPGAAKTRLIPAIGPNGAAAIHRKLTERTLTILGGSGCPVELQATGAALRSFRNWLISTPPLQGRGKGWGASDTSPSNTATADTLHPNPSSEVEGLKLVEQADGDLTDRLTGALNPAPVIFFGADTPDLSIGIVKAAIKALVSQDVVIGPAEDGGYYLLGMARPYPDLLHGIDWSTEQVFAQTMAKAKVAKLRVSVLETLADCDRPEDLARWPWLTA
jgi:uncharacterized protein